MGVAPTHVADLLQQGYRFALSLTHNAARAEDLLQDAWLACLRAGQTEQRAYLLTTIHHRFIDEYRRARRQPTERLSEDWDAPSPPADNDAPLAVANGALEAALANLLPEERAALYLAYVEDWPMQDIAELLGWPRGTLLSLLHRLRRRLRSELEPKQGLDA